MRDVEKRKRQCSEGLLDGDLKSLKWFRFIPTYLYIHVDICDLSILNCIVLWAAVSTKDI